MKKITIKDAFSSIKLFKNLKPFLLSLAIVLLFTFPLFKFELSTDTYHFALNYGLSGIYGAMEYNGRLIIYYVTKLLETMSVTFNGFYYISFIMSIIFSSLSITALYTILKDNMRKSLAFFIALITIFNPMVFELFLFIEKGFFAFAILMAVLGAKSFSNFLNGKSYSIIFSYLFVVLSCFTYQPMPGAFVAISLVFIALYSKSTLQFLKNTVVAITVYGFATFSNFLVMKLLNMSGRMGEGLNFANIYKFLTFGLNIPYLLLVYLFVFLVLFCTVFIGYKIKMEKAFTKESCITFLKYIFVVFGVIITTAAPSIVTTPENVWFTLRYSYPIGTLVGIIPIMYCYKTDFVDNNEYNLLSKCVRGKSILMLFIVLTLMILFHSFFFSRHITNTKDKLDAERINEIISTYEFETGIKVRYISLYKDNNCNSAFNGVVHLPNCNVRAIITPWCDVAHINYYTDRNLKKIDNIEKYKKFFSSKDWDELSEEQFIFVGETLHLGIY